MTVPAATTHEDDQTPLRDVAYHHEPYWHPGQGDWIKSLLLFFGLFELEGEASLSRR